MFGETNDCLRSFSLLVGYALEDIMLLLVCVSTLTCSLLTGDIKKLLAHKTGLKPEEQRLFFRGEEKENEEHFPVEGVKDKSELLLLEDGASKERKLEELRKHNKMLKATEAIAGVRAEVDMLSERVSLSFPYCCSL